MWSGGFPSSLAYGARHRGYYEVHSRGSARGLALSSTGLLETLSAAGAAQNVLDDGSGNMTAAGVVNFAPAEVALGGGAAPTVGTIGGSGPAAAAQHGWLKVKVAGTISFIPVWR